MGVDTEEEESWKNNTKELKVSLEYIKSKISDTQRTIDNPPDGTTLHAAQEEMVKLQQLLQILRLD